MKKVILAVSALILSACNLGNTIANTTEEVANKTATKLIKNSRKTNIFITFAPNLKY